jgi:hypothetical protein
LAGPTISSRVCLKQHNACIDREKSILCQLRFSSQV